MEPVDSILQNLSDGGKQACAAAMIREDRKRSVSLMGKIRLEHSGSSKWRLLLVGEGSLGVALKDEELLRSWG